MKRTKLKIGLLMLLCLAISNVYGQSSETLYYYSFVNSGIDDTWENQSGRWYANANQPATIDYSILNLNETAVLQTTVDFNNTFYKSFVFTVESYDDWTIGNIKSFYYNVDGNTREMTPFNLLSYGNGFYELKYSDTYSKNKVTLIFRARKTDASQNYKVKIRSIKITGVKCYDINSDFPAEQSITDLTDFYNLPDNQPVKMNVESGIVRATNRGMALLQDGNGGVYVNLKNLLELNTSKLPNKGYFSGVVYGVKKTENKIPTLTAVTTVLNSSDGNVVLKDDEPIYITEEEYLTGNYSGKYISMQIENYTMITDILGYYWTNYILDDLNVCANNYSWDYSGLKICGIALPPTPEHQLLAYLYNPRHFWYFLFSDESGIDESIEDAMLNAVVRRSLKAGQWNTLVMPFDIDNSIGELAVFESSGNGVLNFTSTDKVSAGHPFLIKPYEDVKEICNCSIPDEMFRADYQEMMFANPGRYYINTKNLYSTRGGDYDFVPTFNAVQPGEGCYYLAGNNTIKSLSADGTIKGLRAYFQPSTPSAARIRAINVDGITTTISEVCSEEGSEKSEGIYSINGLYLGDNLDKLPKGVYVINGKKVIK